MYLHTKNEGKDFQKLQPEQDRNTETHKQTQPNALLRRIRKW